MAEVFLVVLFLLGGAAGDVEDLFFDVTFFLMRETIFLNGLLRIFGVGVRFFLAGVCFFCGVFFPAEDFGARFSED